MADDQLQRRRNDLSVASGTSLTASSQTLAVQMHLTALNAKSEPPEELAAEFARRFSAESSACLEWAFNTHRDKSNFFPTIAEMLALVKEWKRGKREQEELRQRLQDKLSLEEARTAGLLASPEDMSEMVDRLNKIAQMPEPEHVKRQRRYEERMASPRVAAPCLVVPPELLAESRQHKRCGCGEEMLHEYSGHMRGPDGNYHVQGVEWHCPVCDPAGKAMAAQHERDMQLARRSRAREKQAERAAHTPDDPQTYGNTAMPEGGA
jgi:hypothetical protein